MTQVTVQSLVESKGYRLGLEVLDGGKNLDKAITDSDIHKLGLNLAGIEFSLAQGRIQVIGASEIAFLEMMPEPKKAKIIEEVFNFDIPCMVITRGLEPLPPILENSRRAGIPLLSTELATGVFIQRLNRFLDDYLAPNISLHGVLMDVLGMGILLLGPGGIGKSETALDMILRGHRLVADDIVEIHRYGQVNLIGRHAEMIRFHMEIRGVGIINIESLFGITSTRNSKKLDLVVELMEWEPEQEYDRLGLDEETYTILGVEIPHLKIPVRPGRNVTTIIEVAARNQILKIHGVHSAREFQQQLLAELTGIPQTAGEERE